MKESSVGPSGPTCGGGGSLVACPTVVVVSVALREASASLNAPRLRGCGERYLAGARRPRRERDKATAENRPSRETTTDSTLREEPPQARQRRAEEAPQQ
jgi:hypothetical protein